MKKTTLLFAVSLAALAGCASPHVVDETKVTDDQLGCGDLLAEIKKAEKFEKQARKEKGVTGTNAAAVIFFWPALLATYSNVEEAVEAAQERQTHLEQIYRKKECGG